MSPDVVSYFLDRATRTDKRVRTLGAYAPGTTRPNTYPVDRDDDIRFLVGLDGGVEPGAATVATLEAPVPEPHVVAAWLKARTKTGAAATVAGDAQALTRGSVRALVLDYINPLRVLLGQQPVSDEDVFGPVVARVTEEGPVSRMQEYITEVRTAAQAMWAAYHTLKALQDEWNALDYGNTLEAGAGSNEGVTRSEVGAVVFDTTDEFKLRLIDTAHKTNLANLL